MEKIQVNISTQSARQHAIIARHSNEEQGVSGKRLLLLHGAGVPGELTWTYLANYLRGWDELLIPDIAGMGKSQFLANPAPRLEDFTQQIEELLYALGWHEFDVCGYSFGGMIAHQLLSKTFNTELCFLIEPAMLFSSDQQLIIRKADDYLTVSDQVLANPDDSQPYLDFLNSVSPQRLSNPRIDRLTVDRLKQNSRGFAHALRSVSQALLNHQVEFGQWIAPTSGISFAGELSPASMHGRHRLLAEQSADWQFVAVPGADHSLVFTKPRFIAKAMSQLRQSTL